MKTILKGIKATSEADDRKRISMLESAKLIKAVTDSAGTIPKPSDAEVKSSTIRKATGGVLPISYLQESFKPQYVHECTGEVLDHQLIQAAIMEDLD